MSSILFAIFGLVVQLCAHLGLSTVDISFSGAVIQGGICAVTLWRQHVPLAPSGKYQRSWVALRGVVSNIVFLDIIIDKAFIPGIGCNLLFLVPCLRLLTVR
jgi:hypothetical protein